MTQTIEQLQAKNAELTAEVERLKKAVIDTEEMRGATIHDMEDYRKQLAIAEEHNNRLQSGLKWALNNINCEPFEWSDEENADAHRAAIESLLIPASREALDKYVAEIQAFGNTAKHLLSELLAVLHGDGGHHEDKVGTAQAVEDAMRVFYKLIKQRDLAVEALQFYMDNGVCEMTYYKVRNTLSAIKESEV